MKVTIFTILVFLCHSFSNNLSAGNHELLIRVLNGSGGAYGGTNIKLYRMDDLSQPHRQGSSRSTFDSQIANFACSVNDNDTGGDWEPIFTDPVGTWYYLVFEDYRFMQIWIPEVSQGSNGDFMIEYFITSKTWSLVQAENIRGVEAISNYPDRWDTFYKLNARNSFGGGGQLKQGGLTYSSVSSQGFAFKRPQGNAILEAIDGQSISEGGSTYVRRFDNWQRNGGSPIYSLSVTENLTADVAYEANFLKEFNIVLNAVTGVENGAGGTYAVNGAGSYSSYNGPILQFQNFQSNPTSGWFFREWSDGDTNNPRIPTDHITSGVSAKLKAHLASNHATPTQAIGQRRVVGKADGSEYVLLYESAGEIWSSVLSGGTWQNEARVSTGNGLNGKPSLAMKSSAQTAAWQRHTGGGNHTVYMSTRSGGSWSASPLTVGTTTTEAKPVVSYAVKNQVSYTHAAYLESANNKRESQILNTRFSETEKLPFLG